MILYHASSLEVPHPDISFSRNALDFGKGFYLTLLKEQAVFNTLDLYFDGLINKKEALGRLAFEHPNHQICILKQEIIDECLYFIKSVKL